MWHPNFSMIFHTVYPCVYREHFYYDAMMDTICGLSLCVQGTWDDQRKGLYLYRFIPVCTGNMPCNFGVRQNNRGLSLCVQGTFVYLNYRLNQWRFIPVCTGNIKYHCWKMDGNAVYPCVYREHFFVVGILPTTYGLSLCVQGTYFKRTNRELWGRFIPVCTGNIPFI